jgi:hypothetical protein
MVSRLVFGWQLLATITAHATAHHSVRLCPFAWWYMLTCSICLVNVWPWKEKLQTWIACLDSSLTSQWPADWLLDSSFGQKPKPMELYIIVQGSAHGPDDMCWHVSFALWLYGLGITSFQHELHAWIHHFQVSQWPADWLSLIHRFLATITANAAAVHHSARLCPWT